jgi:predicted PurR-regulated permease PerM
LFGVLTFSVVFIGAIGTLVGSQLADVLTNSKTYVNDTVDFVNSTFNTQIDPAEVNASIANPDGPVQRFIDNQRGRAISLSTSALGMLFQLLSVSLEDMGFGN